MPIVEVEIITRPGEAIDPQLAGALAHQVGAIFGSPPGQTWVKVRTLAGEQYAENHDDPHEAVYPVFVSVLKAKRPAPSNSRSLVV